MTPIYPEVQIIETDDSIVLKTKLVKELNGKYYYWDFYDRFLVEDTREKVKVINRFHSKVYFTLVFGEVNLSLKDMEGNPIFQLALQQISERERLNKKLPQFNSDKKEIL